MIFVVFHTAGINEKKYIIIMKKKKFDAVGWKSYCSRLYCGAGRWQALGARGWADCAQQTLGERACWACQAPAGKRQLGAGGRQGAGRAGRARPGSLGWPWAVHSVHSTYFRSVLTRFFFLESLNEHRSL